LIVLASVFDRSRAPDRGVDPVDTGPALSATHVTLLQLARAGVTHFNKEKDDARESAHKFTTHLPLTMGSIGARRLRAANRGRGPK
jgi:hypothetical protein